MLQNETKVLFAIIGSAIHGNKLTLDENQKEYIHSILPSLLKLSAKHDLIHLAVVGLKKNNLIPEESKDIEKHILKAAFRYEQLKYEYDSLCDLLEKSKIPFLPLKGSIIREYYPEPWMRTSCDVDILLQSEDIERASDILTSSLGYTHHEDGSHDISFFAPSGTHIELHYGLVEDGRINDSTQVLQKVWQTASIRQDFEYFFEMSDEMFYFYHIAHMAKHFQDGGCGIRPFIDLMILDNIDSADHTKRNELLEQGGLLKFADAARSLSRVWLADEEHNTVTKQMEDYVLNGGLYGNQENLVKLQQQQKGGRFKYLLSKVIIPYEIIKFQYPVLQKHRWLTPIMQVRRWGKLIFCGHLKRTAKEIKYSNISQTDADSMQKFLDNIGL